MSHRGGRKEPEKRRTGIQRYKAITRWLVTGIAAAAAIALVILLLH